MFFRKPKRCVLCGSPPSPALNVIKNTNGQFVCSDVKACQQIAKTRQALPFCNADVYTEMIRGQKIVRPLIVSQRICVQGADKKSWETPCIDFVGYTGFTWKYRWGSEEKTYNQTYRLSGEIVFNDSWFQDTFKASEQFSHPFKNGEMRGYIPENKTQIEYFYLTLRARESSAGLMRRAIAEAFSARRGNACFTFGLRKPSEDEIGALIEKGYPEKKDTLIVDGWSFESSFFVEGDLSDFDNF
jgi:hypothetical protein